MAALIVVGACFEWKRGHEVASRVCGFCSDGGCCVAGCMLILQHLGLLLSVGGHSVWQGCMAQGKGRGVGKEKSKPLTEQQQRTLAEVNYLGLDSVAKVVKSFGMSCDKSKNFAFSLL